MISKEEAKKIASKFMEAEVGDPMLKVINGSKIYVVPALINGLQEGEIWIDSNSGKNVGGSGGINY